MNDTPGFENKKSQNILSMCLKALRGERGMALMTVLVFSFVFLIGTMAFFTVAAYEAGQAEMRENSSRAFYLADGAIEHAKAILLEDGRWRAGFPRTALDGGFYRLTIDKVLWGADSMPRFYAEGWYGRTKRDVEVIADIRATTLGLAIYARRNIYVSGNICLDGTAHATDGFYGDGHFRDDCPGTLSSHTRINPPPVYTEPDSFPGATYYYLTVSGPSAAHNPNPDTLFIKDRRWRTLAFYLKPKAGPEQSPHADLSWDYDRRKALLSVTMQSGLPLDPATGCFPRAGTDSAVVVNFGSINLAEMTLKGHVVRHDSTDIVIQQSSLAEPSIKTTIINSRYISTSTAIDDRLDFTNWVGGYLRTKVRATFEPTYCIAMIVQSVYGNAQVSLGTPAHPALTYVMNNADFSQGQWSICGSLVSLGDIKVGGGVNLTFDPGFISCLPKNISENWPVDAAGSMVVLRWREPPPRS